jgi:feruloyl esterase
MPQGSVDYYDEMAATVGGGLDKVQEFARLFMAPGIAHCGTDTGPFFDALVDWVTEGDVPETLPLTVHGGSWTNPTVLRARPLCPHPHVANYKGTGSTNDASNFVCGPQVVKGTAVSDTERCAFEANERVFGVPFVPSGF